MTTQNLADDGCRCLYCSPPQPLNLGTPTIQQILTVDLLDQLTAAIARRDGDTVADIIATLAAVTGAAFAERVVQVLFDVALNHRRPGGPS